MSGRDTQDPVKGAKEPGGWSVGVGGSEAQGHMLLSLVVREVPGQGPSPDELVSCGGSVYISSTSSWGGGVTSPPPIPPPLAWPEEFPRRQSFGANPGTVWGKPLPEACWYFKQQDLKTERRRQK